MTENDELRLLAEAATNLPIPTKAQLLRQLCVMLTNLNLLPDALEDRCAHRIHPGGTAPKCMRGMDVAECGPECARYSRFYFTGLVDRREVVPICLHRGKVISQSSCGCHAGRTYECRHQSLQQPDGAPGRASGRQCGHGVCKGYQPT